MLKSRLQMKTILEWSAAFMAGSLTMMILGVIGMACLHDVAAGEYSKALATATVPLIIILVAHPMIKWWHG